MRAGKGPEQSVCAVIVTFHPSAKMLEVVPMVLAQVQALVVVDNGSTAGELGPLRVSSHELGFQLIENGDNFGIAEALNQGVRWAKDQGFAWIILFDQDSLLPADFMEHMFAAWHAHPLREKVGSVHPRYVDPETGEEGIVPRENDGSPILPMTSGTLMPAWIFERVGWFASDFFIDVVDWDFSFRIRAAGFLVADAKRAALLHAPGRPARATFWGHAFLQSNHSALRRYYISRNRIVFFRKYFLSFPVWVATGAYAQLKETIACLLVEENRGRKLRNILLATWDALTGRMGKREGL